MASVPFPRVAAVALALLVLSVCGAVAEDKSATKGVDEKLALRTSQSAIGRELGDYTFTTSLNRSVRLSDYRGKPLVISLIYTSCADICPVVSETLADAVDVAREALGPDSFHVVTVGFDALHDSPERMRAFARRHGLDLDQWDFLSAEAAIIDDLAADLGFLFYAGPQGFDHMAQTTVVDSEGLVYRQVYGASFETPLLVEPLKELVFGRPSNIDTLSGIINKVRLFCTIYNPATDRYRFDYSIFIMMVMGTLSLGTIGFFLIRGWVRNRRLHLG